MDYMYTEYHCLIVSTGEVLTRSFLRSGGLPEMEALRLINLWNYGISSKPGPKFVYWLEPV